MSSESNLSGGVPELGSGKNLINDLDDCFNDKEKATMVSNNFNNSIIAVNTLFLDNGNKKKNLTVRENDEKFKQNVHENEKTKKDEDGK